VGTMVFGGRLGHGWLSYGLLLASYEVVDMGLSGDLLAAGSCVACALALGLAACGEGSGEVGGGGNGGSGDGGVPDLPYDVGGPGTCDGTAIATNADVCAAVPGPTNCSAASDKQVESCGVLVKAPTGDNELVRTTDTVEYAGTGAVDLSCFDPSSYPPKPGASQTVSIEGHVKIFAAGCDSKDVTIEIYKVAADGSLGEMVGSPVTTSVDSPAIDDEFTGDCPDARVLRAFRYDGVPTETQLVIVTSGAPGKGWAKLYEYAMYISNSDPALDGGVWKHDLRALAEDDFSTIPSAAMGQTITSGNGAIAGEIHDCGDIRLSYAMVDVDKPRKSLVYLNDNESDPMPELSRGAIGTARMGLYAALDIPPGPVTVSAVGVLDGKLVTLGYAKAYVYPNAVTAVTLRGVRPYQVP